MSTPSPVMKAMVTGNEARGGGGRNFTVFFSHTLIDAFRTTLVSKQTVASHVKRDYRTLGCEKFEKNFAMLGWV